MTGANDYNCSTIQGFHNSDDSGATWRHHCLPSVNGGSGCGDPALAYDRNGVAYIMGIRDCSVGDISMQSSPDNGVTWGAAHLAFTSMFAGGFTDKEWLEADTSATSPHVNCLYVSWTDFDSAFTKTRIGVAHSCDGGTTWTRVAVDATNTIPKIDQFSDLAIGQDGTVYVTWMQCQTSGAAGDCGGTTVKILASKSTDGGTTWSAPALVHNVKVTPDTCFCAYYGNVPTTSERVSNIPSVDVDTSGNLYVVDYDYTGSYMRAQVAKSTDGGATWGAPVAVNPSSTSDQFLPWLSVDDGTGGVGVSYLLRSGSQYTATATGSLNGGASFQRNLAIATAPSKFANDGFGGGFMGDYTGNIFTGSVLHASWPDARTAPAKLMTGGVMPS
jgi:hypothetical protein